MPTQDGKIKKTDAPLSSSRCGSFPSFSQVKHSFPALERSLRHRWRGEGRGRHRAALRPRCGGRASPCRGSGRAGHRATGEGGCAAARQGACVPPAPCVPPAGTRAADSGAAASRESHGPGRQGAAAQRGGRGAGGRGGTAGRGGRVPARVPASPLRPARRVRGVLRGPGPGVPAAKGLTREDRGCGAGAGRAGGVSFATSESKPKVLQAEFIGFER